MKKNSFICGALILMTANGISKVLGAVFKIPLTYIINEEGMAVYNTAFTVYIMFLSFIVSGVPFAVQKLTASYHARGQHDSAREVIHTASVLLTAGGALCSIILWLGADFFALAMKEERAVFALKMLAPSVFFVALGATVKSGFQGAQNMIPTAVSQVTEAFIKLIAGYIFAVMLIRFGTEYSAGGAAAGVTVGEIAATLILVLWYLFYIKNTPRDKASAKEIRNKLFEIALPMMLMSVISAGLSMCDTSLLRISLIKSGLSPEDARFVYGAYTGYALTVLNLPSGLLGTLGVSIIPIVSGASSTGNYTKLKAITRKGIAVSFVCGTLAAVTLYIFSDLILKILFHNTYSAGILRLASPSVLFICLMQITCSVLQAMGHIGLSFISSITASLIKIGFTVFLASSPNFGIYGTVIGTDTAFFVGALINLIILSILIKQNSIRTQDFDTLKDGSK